MRVIWSFGGGALDLLEHGPNEGDSDYGIRSPEYLAVKGCRAVSGMPGVYQYDELLERSENLLIVWEWIESEWIDHMRRKIGDELSRQGRDPYTGEKIQKGA